MKKKTQWHWLVAKPNRGLIQGFSKSEKAALRTSRRAALEAAGLRYPDLRYGIWTRSEVVVDEQRHAKRHGFRSIAEMRKAARAARKAFADQCVITVQEWVNVG